MRLELAQEFGADQVINIDHTTGADRLAVVRELTCGRGADVVIEASGSPAAVKEGMLMTRDAGTYVVAGQYTDNGDVTINPHLELNKKHLTVKGTWGIDLSHFYRSLKVMEKYQSRFAWEKIISQQYSLQETNQALADVENRRVMKAVITPNS